MTCRHHAGAVHEMDQRRSGCRPARAAHHGTGAGLCNAQSKRSGAVANAIKAAEGSRFWETRLGVPLAAPPIVAGDASKAIAVTAAGALFEVPAAGMASRKLMDAPAAGNGEKIALAADQELVQLDDGRAVLTPRRANAAAGIAELLVYDPRSADNKLRRTKLIEPAASRPVSYAGGLLVPTKIGQVSVIDPDSGRQLIEPFQPVVEVGRDIAWTDPTVYGDKQVLISDGQAKLYRLATAKAPRPHLEAAATLDLATPLVTAAAVAGDFAYAVDPGNHLLSFRLPDLKPGDDWPLDARGLGAAACRRSSARGLDVRTTLLCRWHRQTAVAGPRSVPRTSLSAAQLYRGATCLYQLGHDLWPGAGQRQRAYANSARTAAGAGPSFVARASFVCRQRWHFARRGRTQVVDASRGKV